MTLRSIFREGYALAAQRQTPDRPGEYYRGLAGGADIRIRAQGRKRQVILGRRRVAVSEEEIRTFRRDGEIPEHAARRDYVARGGWRYVALTWEAPATLWELEGPGA